MFTTNMLLGFTAVTLSAAMRSNDVWIGKFNIGKVDLKKPWYGYNSEMFCRMGQFFPVLYYTNLEGIHTEIDLAWPRENAIEIANTSIQILDTKLEFEYAADRREFYKMLTKTAQFRLTEIGKFTIGAYTGVMCCNVDKSYPILLYQAADGSTATIELLKSCPITQGDTFIQIRDIKLEFDSKQDTNAFMDTLIQKCESIGFAKHLRVFKEVNASLPDKVDEKGRLGWAQFRGENYYLRFEKSSSSIEMYLENGDLVKTFSGETNPIIYGDTLSYNHKTIGISRAKLFVDMIIFKENKSFGSAKAAMVFRDASQAEDFWNNLEGVTKNGNTAVLEHKSDKDTNRWCDRRPGEKDALDQQPDDVSPTQIPVNLGAGVYASSTSPFPRWPMQGGSEQ